MPRTETPPIPDAVIARSTPCIISSPAAHSPSHTSAFSCQSSTADAAASASVSPASVDEIHASFAARITASRPTIALSG